MQGGMGRGGAWSGMGGGGAWSAAGPALQAMMRGWSGEGAAGGGHHQAHDAAHQATADAHKAAQEAHEQVHKAAQEAAAAAASMTGNEDYLKNVGSFVAAALDPLGIDVKIDIETPEGRKSCHVSKQSSEE